MQIVNSDRVEQCFCLYLFAFHREGLSVSRQLGDRALEAQACYSLGSVHSLLGDNQQSVEYHERHKEIAEELNDR